MAHIKYMVVQANTKENLAIREAAKEGLLSIIKGAKIR